MFNSYDQKISSVMGKPRSLELIDSADCNVTECSHTREVLWLMNEEVTINKTK